MQPWGQTDSRSDLASDSHGRPSPESGSSEPDNVGSYGTPALPALAARQRGRPPSQRLGNDS
jgi:hypothetical protein